MVRCLGKEGFAVATAASGEEGLALARSLEPVAIVLDVLMPGMDGWAVLTALKEDAVLREIPVVMVTVVEDRNMGFALGAVDYLTKPVDRDRLAAVLRKYRRGSEPGAVLLVEDDASTRAMLRRMLESEGWSADEAENGRVALERVAAQPPGLILLDLMMPEMDGFEFVEALRRREEWRRIPVVVITARDLDGDDRRRLNGSVERILRKGDYTRESLLDELRRRVTCSARARQSAAGAT
jgi:CheY-like chemotaxis protein